METSGFRHQGFMYSGSPSHHIPLIAPVIKARLEQKRRCLYLNSTQMVADLRSHLAQIGVDVVRETEKKSLILDSHLSHLTGNQNFDIDRMLTILEEALNQALLDGYAGLWATGDVAWEFGPKGDFGQLAQYEMRLEKFLCTHAEFSGICQYHASVLPPDVMRTGHELHHSFFINQAQSRLNPDYRAMDRVQPITATESVFDLSLPHDMHRRASALADSQGITLNEFIHRAIAEKLHPPHQKNLKN
jgi:predicted HicB family RNase H-like nuclease